MQFINRADHTPEMYACLEKIDEVLKTLPEHELDQIEQDMPDLLRNQNWRWFVSRARLNGTCPDRQVAQIGEAAPLMHQNERPKQGKICSDEQLLYEAFQLSDELRQIAAEENPQVEEEKKDGIECNPELLASLFIFDDNNDNESKSAVIESKRQPTIIRSSGVQTRSALKRKRNKMSKPDF